MVSMMRMRWGDSRLRRNKVIHNSCVESYPKQSRQIIEVTQFIAFYFVPSKNGGNVKLIFGLQSRRQYDPANVE